MKLGVWVNSDIRYFFDKYQCFYIVVKLALLLIKVEMIMLNTVGLYQLIIHFRKISKP